MPWFPDCVAAVELGQDAQAGGKADPAAQHLRSLERGDVRSRESVWPGIVVIEDPRGGAVRSYCNARHEMP